MTRQGEETKSYPHRRKLIAFGVSGIVMKSSAAQIAGDVLVRVEMPGVDGVERFPLTGFVLQGEKLVLASGVYLEGIIHRSARELGSLVDHGASGFLMEGPTANASGAVAVHAELPGVDEVQVIDTTGSIQKGEKLVLAVGRFE